jgi:glutathione S-transferase
MIVYGDAGSGNCLKVKYTADFLALPYTWRPVDITKGETRTPEFLAINPAGEVPAVVFGDGRAIAQSNAIIRFLARGSDLLPEDAYDQAKVDELLFWEQYSHEPYVAVCRYLMVYLGKSKEERDPKRVSGGEEALDFLESKLKGGEWLASDRFTIADISLLAYTRLADEGGFDMARRPGVLAWIRRCEAALKLPERRYATN